MERGRETAREVEKQKRGQETTEKGKRGGKMKIEGFGVGIRENSS